jgi:hypothetical protein
MRPQAPVRACCMAVATLPRAALVLVGALCVAAAVAVGADHGVVAGDRDRDRYGPLGPVVVNRDGTARRIANWREMTDGERARTARIIMRRNRERSAALQADLATSRQEEAIAAGSVDVGAVGMKVADRPNQDYQAPDQRCFPA